MSSGMLCSLSLQTSRCDISLPLGLREGSLAVEIMGSWGPLCGKPHDYALNFESVGNMISWLLYALLLVPTPSHPSFN